MARRSDYADALRYTLAWLAPTIAAVPVEDLYALAIRYHALCERFDRLVCTACCPKTGAAQPWDGREAHLVALNAKKVRARLLPIAIRMGESPTSWDDAIRQTARAFEECVLREWAPFRPDSYQDRTRTADSRHARSRQ